MSAVQRSQWPLPPRVFQAQKLKARQEQLQRVWGQLQQASKLPPAALALLAWVVSPETEAPLRAASPPRSAEEPPSRLDAVLRHPQALWPQRLRQGASRQSPESTAEQSRVQAWVAAQSCVALDAQEQSAVAQQQPPEVWPACPEPSQRRVLPPCSAEHDSCEPLLPTPAFSPEWPSSRRRAWRRAKDRFSV